MTTTDIAKERAETLDDMYERLIDVLGGDEDIAVHLLLDLIERNGMKDKLDELIADAKRRVDGDD